MCTYAGSNILVEQSCSCPTVIECTCSPFTFDAKLADFDFIKETTGTRDIIWAKPLPYIPGGTVGMQAPEVYQLKFCDLVCKHS